MMSYLNIITRGYVPFTEERAMFWQLPVAGALVSGLAGVVSGAAQGAGEVKAAREYNKGQMRLAQYQNAWNLTQWNRQNDYNSPLAQMERYREAGLNPNLAIGNSGNSTSTVTAATPDLKPVQPSFSKWAAAINNGMQLATAYYQAAQMDKALKSKDLQNDKQSMLNDRIRLENGLLFTDEYFRAKQREAFANAQRADFTAAYSAHNYQNMLDLAEYAKQIKRSQSDILKTQSQFTRRFMEQKLRGMIANNSLAEKRGVRQDIENNYLDEYWQNKNRSTAADAILKESDAATEQWLNSLGGSSKTLKILEGILKHFL